jgi:hypothetical protein
MNPGKFDTAVMFRRRAIGGDGRRSGKPEDFFRTNAGWRPLGARTLIEAGIDTDAVQGTLTIRDQPRARLLENEDRAVFNGSSFYITSVSVPDRSGLLHIQVERKVGG